MPPLIDLHAHVLPGVDDGPATLEQALDLLRAMAAQGVQVVVATPHGADGYYNATGPQVREKVAQVQAAARAAGIAITVLAGMELRLDAGLVPRLKRGELLTLAGTPWVCVELPHSTYPPYTEWALFELMVAGYRPVLAHPERNRGIQQRPERLERLAEQGVLACVMAGSLLGRHGPEAQRLAARFLAGGTATLLASDAHDLDRRPPLLAQALAEARRLGKANQAAEAALLGLPIPTPQEV